ncbi:MAG: hypothetical protein ACRCX2_12800 [Paraclostridium sp.]
MNTIKATVMEILNKEAIPADIIAFSKHIPDGLYAEISRHPEILVKIIYIMVVVNKEGYKPEPPSKGILTLPEDKQIEMIIHYIHELYRFLLNR